MKINKPGKTTGINHKSYDVSHLKKHDGIDPSGEVADGSNKKYAKSFKDKD